MNESTECLRRVGGGDPVGGRGWWLWEQLWRRDLMSLVCKLYCLLRALLPQRLSCPLLSYGGQRCRPRVRARGLCDGQRRLGPPSPQAWGGAELGG